MQDVDLTADGGLTLALALWSRAAVLLELGNGQAALSDLQYSLVCGLPAKEHGSYYVRLAKANACKLPIYSYFSIAYLKAFSCFVAVKYLKLSFVLEMHSDWRKGEN